MTRERETGVSMNVLLDDGSVPQIRTAVVPRVGERLVIRDAGGVQWTLIVERITYRFQVRHGGGNDPLVVDVEAARLDE